jgi:cobyrinic acid a,c-diamide synthase
MLWNIPRIIISGLAGGCGKTFASVGITSALKSRGIDVYPFKKGPDYIDSAWLSSAAEKPCYNLDTFLMGNDGVMHSFEQHTGINQVCNYCDNASCAKCDRLKEFLKNKIAIIEGNRGIFDGMDDSGTYSTAELSKLLKAPVVLVLDSTKSTRTLAAEVLGCQKMDVDVRIAGVILNRIGGKRHEEIARASIEKICGIPVIGAIPKLESNKFPERHLGLITPDEYPEIKEAVAYAGKAAEDYITIDKLVDLTHTGKPLLMKRNSKHAVRNRVIKKVRVGIIRDAAFSFYYPDNIEALESLGAEIIEVSALTNHALPDIDALYIGGGFPETNALKLAGNEKFKTAVKEAVEDGLPVYAECGGAIYMGKSVTYKDKTYLMTGVLPVEFYFDKRPQGHGYTVLEVESENPYFELHSIIHGHEFHYSRGTNLASNKIKFIFKIHKGYGFNKTQDGICYKNLLAVYSHIHAAGTTQWAKNLIRAASAYSIGRNRDSNLKNKDENKIIGRGKIASYPPIQYSKFNIKKFEQDCKFNI